MRRLLIVVGACVLGLGGCERGRTKSPDEAKGDATSDGAKALHSGAPVGTDSADPNAECRVDIEAASETTVGRYPSLNIEVDPPIQHHGGPTPALHVQVLAPDGELREQDFPLSGQSTCAFCLPAPGSGGCNHSCTYESYSSEETSFGRMIKVAGTHQLRFSLRNLPCALNLASSRIDVAPKPDPK